MTDWHTGVAIQPDDYIQVHNRDVIAGLGRDADTCKERHRVTLGKNVTELFIEWEVGGGFNVDETRIFVSKGKWNTLTHGEDEDKTKLSCEARDIKKEILEDVNLFEKQSLFTNGKPLVTRWTKPDDVKFRPKYYQKVSFALCKLQVLLMLVIFTNLQSNPTLMDLEF